MTTNLAGPAFQLQFAVLVFSALEVNVYLSSSLPFSCNMLVAILLGVHASAYFIFGVFISIYFCHDLCHAILGECIYIYIYIFFFFSFCLCYMGVQVCGNLNDENKMWDIGKGTYMVVRNSENGETYGTAAS